MDGLPVISYYYANIGRVKVAHCGDVACSTGNTLTNVYLDVSHMYDTAITIGADGLPLILYRESDLLTIVHCKDITCSEFTDTHIFVSTNHEVSIAIGVDGLPILSYCTEEGNNLKVTHCGSFNCSWGNSDTIVDSTGSACRFNSITIGGDGMPVISYYDETNKDLKVAHCGDITCSVGNTIMTLDSENDVGEHTAITIGVDGLPVISYYKEGTGNLKVIHCSNVFCIPYWKRR